MCSVALGLLFKKNFAVMQVLQVGMWKSQSTFPAYCLRDLTLAQIHVYILHWTYGDGSTGCVMH